LKQVTEIPLKLQDEPEKRQAVDDDTYDTNKSNERVSKEESVGFLVQVDAINLWKPSCMIN
jgi:hypothetical protein